MSEVELRKRLERFTRKPISLTVTDNRSSMVYVSPGTHRMVKVRVHHMFLDAPIDVVRALAQFIRRPNQECHRALDGYIKRNAHRIGGKPRRRVAINLSHRGFHFDLKQVYEKLNRTYFGGQLRVAITWGKSNGANRRYSIDFGSYDTQKRIIRINPALDRPSVPRFFVEYVVFHEMLHADLGVEETPDGRTAFHSPRFREEERQFRFYRSALRWESANLWRFLKTT